MRRCRGSSVHRARKRGREAHMRRGQGERNDPGGRSRTPRTPPRKRPYLGERRWLAVPGCSMRRCRGSSVHLARKRGREAHMRRGQGEMNENPGKEVLPGGSTITTRAKSSARVARARAAAARGIRNSAGTRQGGRARARTRPVNLQTICKRKGRGGALRCTASKDGDRGLVDRVHGTTRAQRSQNKKNDGLFKDIPVTSPSNTCRCGRTRNSPENGVPRSSQF